MFNDKLYIEEELIIICWKSINEEIELTNSYRLPALLVICLVKNVLVIHYFYLIYLLMNLSKWNIRYSDYLKFGIRQNNIIRGINSVFPFKYLWSWFESVSFMFCKNKINVICTTVMCNGYHRLKTWQWELVRNI